MSESGVNILCQDLWKVFGPSTESIWDAISNGASKQEVLEQNPEGPWRALEYRTPSLFLQRRRKRIKEVMRR